MRIKKNLAIAAAVAVLAVPALGATNANVHVNADTTTTITGRLNHSYKGYPAGTPVYDGHYHNQVGQPKGDGNGALGHPYDNSHPLVNIPEAYVSGPNAKISNNKPNNKQSTQTSESNTGVQNGKLAQTSESNTGAKVGIVGAIAAMASVAFAGVEKFFKRA